MIINPDDHLRLKLHSGVPDKSLEYSTYCLCSEKLVFASETTEVYCDSDVFHHWTHRDVNPLVYEREPSWQQMIDFIELLSHSFGSFDTYCYESFNISDEFLSHPLCVDDDDNSLGPLFHLRRQNRLINRVFQWILERISKRDLNVVLKKKLVEINIGMDVFSIRFDDFEEFKRFLNVVRWYMHYASATNYVFWFPREDVFCMLCHENDLHLYFKPDKKDLLDEVVSRSQIQNNTDVWNSYYPCM